MDKPELDEPELDELDRLREEFEAEKAEENLYIMTLQDGEESDAPADDDSRDGKVSIPTPARGDAALRHGGGGASLGVGLLWWGVGGGLLPLMMRRGAVRGATLALAVAPPDAPGRILLDASGLSPDAGEAFAATVFAAAEAAEAPRGRVIP